MMKIDIKTLILLGSIAVAFGGFYYGTEYRLSNVEADIQALQENDDDLGQKINKAIKRIKRLEK